MMNKYAFTGLLLCLAGGVIVGFQKLSMLMGREDDWKTLSIDQMLTEKHLEMIEGMDPGLLKDVVDFVVTWALWKELMVVGAALLVISGFMKK